MCPAMRFFAILAALSALSASAQSPPDSTALLAKMERMVIPAAEFRNARATDVLDFLFEASSASDPDANRSLGLISPPKTIPVFELEDGSAPDLPPLDFSAQRLPLLQVIDLVCGYAGLQFAIGPSGPEFFLPDGRRLVRKEVPAPPPADSSDEWGFGAGGFAGPGELAPAQPDGIDWEPFVRSYAATPAEREAILERMGFACSRHKGEYAQLREPAPLAAGLLHPQDRILAVRQVGETLWTVQVFIDANGQALGQAIHPHPGF